MIEAVSVPVSVKRPAKRGSFVPLLLAFAAGVSVSKVPLAAERGPPAGPVVAWVPPVVEPKFARPPRTFKPKKPAPEPAAPHGMDVGEKPLLFAVRVVFVTFLSHAAGIIVGPHFAAFWAMPRVAGLLARAKLAGPAARAGAARLLTRARPLLGGLVRA